MAVMGLDFVRARPECVTALRAVAASAGTVLTAWEVFGAPSGSDRQWDRAIQKLRRRGLVMFATKGWILTDDGAAVVAALDAEPPAGLDSGHGEGRQRTG